MKFRYSSYNSSLKLTLKYAILFCRYKNKWLYVRNKQRATWEIPGGKLELGESIENCAERELKEETGATKFKLVPIEFYEIVKNEKSLGSGAIFFAEIYELNFTGEHEIAEYCLRENFFELHELTYPEIQTEFFERYCNKKHPKCFELFENKIELYGNKLK